MFHLDDAYKEIYDKVYPPIPTDDPNDREYSETSLGTLSNINDTESLLSIYNHDTNYSNGDTLLACGNRITINNVTWMIAGFDVESNRTASDGTTYDNGYGIMLVPVTYVSKEYWNKSDTTKGGYMSSYMHNTVLPGIVSNLQAALGTHLIQRNVLLSSEVPQYSSPYQSTAYTWTTAYATLMSVGQCTGTFANNSNKYDDGEANYQLPVFTKTSYKIGNYFWFRGVGGKATDSGSTYKYNVYEYTAMSATAGFINTSAACWSQYGVRPLIYIR